MTSTDECRPNRTEKTETAVNFVKSKLKTAVFCKTKPKSFFANRTPLKRTRFRFKHCQSRLGDQQSHDDGWVPVKYEANGDNNTVAIQEADHTVAEKTTDWT